MDFDEPPFYRNINHSIIGLLHVDPLRTRRMRILRILRFVVHRNRLRLECRTRPPRHPPILHQGRCVFCCGGVYKEGM